MDPAATVCRASALARSPKFARRLVAIRDYWLHRPLPPARTRHTRRHDRRKGGNASAAGSPLPGPALRMDPHWTRGSHNGTRVADPPVHHPRWNRSGFIGPEVGALSAVVRCSSRPKRATLAGTWMKLRPQLF